jgi:hypothetical protein
MIAGMGGTAGTADRSGRRIAVAYLLLLALVAVVAVVVLRAGADRHPTPAVGGAYRLDQSPPCLGAVGQRLELEQSGQFVGLDGPDRVDGELRLRDGRLDGPVTCRDGRPATAAWLADGTTLSGPVDGGVVVATRVPAPVAEAAAGARPPGAEEFFGQLTLAIAAVMLAARGVGAVAGRLGQPQVMGEVLAGILLGPTLLATVAPDVFELLFPAWVLPLLRGAADIGLAFYMFLVGLELDPRLLRERFEQAALISHASIALPLALGMAVALPLFELVGPDTSFGSFALFMGVAMSITAFPVLARILVERRMLRDRMGVAGPGLGGRRQQLGRCCGPDRRPGGRLLPGHGAGRAAAAGPDVAGLRRGRPRARRLGRGHLRRGAAVVVRRPAHRHCRHLRSLRHGPDHAAAGRPDP